MTSQTDRRQRVAKNVLEGQVADKGLQNRKSEMGVCGCVLHNNDLFPVLSDILQAQDFSDIFLAFVWHAFEKLADAGKGIDQITVFEFLNVEQGCPLRDADLMEAISKLYGAVADIQNAEDYAHSIRESALKIRILLAATTIANLVQQNPQMPAEKLKDDANLLMFTATEQRADPNTTAKYAMQNYFEELEALTLSGINPGIHSGFAALDDLLHGFAPGEVSILAGSEGMGKTSLLLSMVRFMVKVMKKNVVLFSLEMTQAEIIRAFVAMESGVPKDILKAGGLSSGQWQKFVGVSTEISSWPMHIVDHFHSLTPIQLQRKLRSIMSREKVDIVIVDGLWLMDSNNPSLKDGRARDVTNIMRELNHQAKTFKLPYLVAHQYKSEIGSRADKRPSIYDMSESAGVRRNAQVILGLYRDSHYNFGGDDTTRLYILKDRNGRATGRDVVLEYDAQRSCYKGGADANQRNA